MGKYLDKKLARETLDKVGKNYSVGKGTTTKLVNNLRQIARFAAERGLQSIQNINTKFVNAYVDTLKDRGLSNSTITGHMTALRTLALAIHKDNIVCRSNKEYGVSRTQDERMNPKIVNSEQRSKVNEALYEKGKHLGLAHDMQKAFGLRNKEALMSNKVNPETGKLVVIGAKGGRPREVEIKSEIQRQTLERVQAHIKETGGRSLIPPDKTLKSGIRQYSNALYAAGARKETNSNAHLSRHEFVQEMRASGEYSDREISNAVGHGREAILGCYIP